MNILNEKQDEAFKAMINGKNIFKKLNQQKKI